MAPELLGLIDLWILCRGGGLAPDNLPFAGGAADQPAWIMAAFAVIQATAAALQPERGEAS